MPLLLLVLIAAPVVKVSPPPEVLRHRWEREVLKIRHGADAEEKFREQLRAL